MSQRFLIVRVGLLAALYFGSAKLGIELSVAHGVITPVWVPTGLSLAALLLFGYRLWPGVAIGAFLANATSDLPLVLAAAIAIGNTLEAVVGTYLLKRVGFVNSLERVRDVLALVVLGAFVATAVSATNGVVTLWLGGELSGANVTSEWLLWWFGDAIGALLVAPFLLAWLSPRKSQPSGHPVEGVFLILAVAGASSVVFVGGNWQYPYVLFPLFVWAAIRFTQIGATTSVLVVGVIGTIGTVQGAVPIGGATRTESVQILQALIAVVGVAIYIIAASIAERDFVGKELQRALGGLADAQALAHVGSWEWDIPHDRVNWSDEMFRIYGYEPQAFDVTFEKAMERVVAEDHARVAAAVEEELKERRDRANPPMQYRIRRPDGSERTLIGKGRIKFSDGGVPLNMVGTVEDVTELMTAQHELSEAYRRERDASDRLRELDQIKNTFMSAVSHDLRTPLTVIAGLAEVLMERLDRMDRTEVISALSRMHAGALRASNVLSNLLEVDRVSKGQVHPAKTDVDLGNLSATVTHSLEPSEGPPVEMPHQQQVFAWVDQGLVERIIENLLLNAIRHTPKDTPISMRFLNQDGGVVLCIDDAGPGIPDPQKEAIFEPFERGPDASAIGSGVGLFLVRRFAELHGGRAWVEDRPGGGSSFRVFFPRRDEAVERGAAG
jgi:PAS domain S-box-containing protein